MYILSSNSTQNTRGLEPTCYLPVQPHAFDVQHNLGATSIARNLTFGIYQPDVHTLTFDWQQQLLTEKLNSFQPSELLDPMGMNATDAVAAESTIKYHLVEAEEVGHKSQPSATRNPKPKRKSKFNWSQVPVEGDEMVTPESEESVGSGTNKEDVRADVRMRVGQYDQQHSRGGWYPRNGGRSGGRRQYRDSHGSFYNGVYVPTPDVTVTAQWAKNQIEFYFTCDNLVRDIFLRQHMDVDGYVPLAFVGSFQAVYSVHQDYESLFEAMKHSKTIQLDEQNEKIRLRTDWQKWVWPNTNGGYGVPRYVKHKTDEAAAA